MCKKISTLFKIQANWSFLAIVSTVHVCCVILTGWRTQSSFHSTKNSSLNFQKLSVTIGTAFSGISERGQPYDKPNFWKFLGGISVTFEFAFLFWMNGKCP